MKRLMGRGFIGALAISVLLVLGCSKGGGPETKGQATGPKAIAVLYPTAGNTVHGSITFTQEKGGMRVMASIEGLSPGLHGFHIHEYGDCLAPDGTSAGGHFNPTQMPHAGPMTEKRHEGDLGNIEANSEGIAKLNVLDTQMSFEGAKSIIGRGVIVHAQPDDYKTQPTGNSGARVACGVIGITK